MSGPIDPLKPTGPFSRIFSTAEISSFPGSTPKGELYPVDLCGNHGEKSQCLSSE